jgi:UDP-glucose 4-epimerase
MDILTTDSNQKKILVTGGAGYIGSHTIIELLSKGLEVVVLDNLSNSNLSVIKSIESISKKKLTFIKEDIRDDTALNKLFSMHSFNAVIHFAGLKAVGESVSNPILYYENNVRGTLNLLSVMKRHGLKNIVFSSSATVYGELAKSPLKESLPEGKPVNPYGKSKLMIENILNDLYQADNDWNISILRYFNPVGAHQSGLIGENPKGIPNNLMPLVCEAAAGKRECINVFGKDYNTPDGTGIRDYIHVMDLANGHAKAFDKVVDNCGLITVNLGTGKGYSVLELIKSFEKASDRTIKIKFVDRRPGDLDISIACPDHAKEILGWRAKYNLHDMCVDSWRWQNSKKND